MIAALALFAATSMPVRVLEMVEDSPYIVVQTYIKAPAKMGERETAAWHVLGRVLLEGTIEYTPQTLRDYGSQAGVVPSVTVMPDFMRLQIVLPKSGLSLAGDLTFAILTRTALREEDIAKAIVALSGEERTAWVTAMSGIDVRYDRLRQGDVRHVWTRAIRAENLNFVVAGGIDSGAGKQELETRFERWVAPRDPGALRADLPATPKIAHLGPVSTFILSGKTMTPASTASAAKLVAVFALGVGKESSMHRALRESRGLSYLQSAVLWPTSAGWTPNFTMVRRTTADEAKYATEMRDALTKDIEGWSDATLKRAQAMAEAAFSRNFTISPIWLSQSGPMSTTLFDRCAWRGYLEMVGSGALREEVMVGAMKNVDLDQLKEQAKVLLDECNVGWLPGRP